MYCLEERKQVLNAAQEIYETGMVNGTWGNVSTRSDGKLMVITPSGMDYASLNIEDMVVVDETGTVIEGIYRPSMETPLHLDLYAQRPDVKAIVHVHSIYATAFAVAGRSLPVILEETAQVIGHEVQVAEYARCGSGELAAKVTKTLGINGKAVLMANHGLIAAGRDIQEALKICYIAEKTARIALYASVLGEPRSLGIEDIRVLNDKFKGYGQEK